MNKLLSGLSVLLIAVFVFWSPSTNADGHLGQHADGWGNSGAVPVPYEDSSGARHWWWPTTPSSDADDSEIWGNHGLVYGKYTPPPPPPPPPAPAVVAPPAVPAPVVQRQVPVLNSILFGFDKSTVSADGSASLQKAVNYLNKHPKDTLVVEGHTCDINNSGNPDYNVELGQRRADAIATVLSDKGIDSSRIKASSLGGKKPAVANDSSENRASNRRVVFVFKIAD